MSEKKIVAYQDRRSKKAILELEWEKKIIAYQGRRLNNQASDKIRNKQAYLVQLQTEA